MFNKIRRKSQRFTTFNCQGLNYNVKQTHIADDFYKFSLAATMVQETRIKETGLHKFTSFGGKNLLFIIIQTMQQNRSEELG